MINMSNSSKVKKFGWPAVRQSYNFCDLVNDSWFPLLLSLIITFIRRNENSDMLDALHKIAGLGLTVVPVMLTLLLAAYTILMTMYWNPICEKMKSSERGIKLLKGLNASFAVAIRVIALGVLYLFIVNSVDTIYIQMSTSICEVINSIYYCMALYFIFFSICILKDIVINIYNIASFSIESDSVKP